MNDTVRLSISAPLFAIVAAYRKREYSYHEHLTGAPDDHLDDVLVEPHPDRGALIVATNRHLIAVAYDPAGDIDAPRRIPVSKPLLKKSHRGFGRCYDLRLEHCPALDRLVVRKRGVDLHIEPPQEPCDLPFPDWRTMFPADAQWIPGFRPINTKYASMLANTADEIVDAGLISEGWTFLQHFINANANPEVPNHQAMLVRFHQFESLAILAMPVEGEIATPAEPNFIERARRPS